MKKASWCTWHTRFGILSLGSLAPQYIRYIIYSKPPETNYICFCLGDFVIGDVCYVLIVKVLTVWTVCSYVWWSGNLSSETILMLIAADGMIFKKKRRRCGAGRICTNFHKEQIWRQKNWEAKWINWAKSPHFIGVSKRLIHSLGPNQKLKAICSH